MANARPFSRAQSNKASHSLACSTLRCTCEGKMTKQHREEHEPSREGMAEVFEKLVLGYSGTCVHERNRHLCRRGRRLRRGSRQKLVEACMLSFLLLDGRSMMTQQHSAEPEQQSQIFETSVPDRKEAAAGHQARGTSQNWGICGTMFDESVHSKVSAEWHLCSQKKGFCAGQEGGCGGATRRKTAAACRDSEPPKHETQAEASRCQRHGRRRCRGRWQCDGR